jgi:Cu-Zn family superoxide dismutase
MRTIYPVGLLVLSVLGPACSAGRSQAPAPPPPKQQGIERIQVAVDAKSGSGLFGTAIFTREGRNIVLRLNVDSAPPGKHAVHLHETGDCSAADASSAGAHWNPTHANHGPWGGRSFHLGDIGNLPVHDDGMGTLQITTDRWSMGTGQDNDIVGKALVIHEKEDDFVTQPTGNAGARIGCGVVQP